VLAFKTHTYRNVERQGKWAVSLSDFKQNWNKASHFIKTHWYKMYWIFKRQAGLPVQNHD